MFSNTHFFISNTFSMPASVLLNTYKHHHTETLLFIFTIFVSMYRSRSIYVIPVLCIFHFHLHLHYDLLYNFMNTDTLVFFLILQNVSYYFWMVTWMKYVNNFQIAKIKPQGVVQHLLDFFDNISLALLIIVLLIIKKLVVGEVVFWCNVYNT